MRTFDDLINSLFGNKNAIARQKELERQAERDKYQREYVRQQDDNSLMGQPIAVIEGTEGQGSLLAQARAIEAAEREKTTEPATKATSSEETESFLYKPAVEDDTPTYVSSGMSSYFIGGYTAVAEVVAGEELPVIVEKAQAAVLVVARVVAVECDLLEMNNPKYGVLLVFPARGICLL